MHLEAHQNVINDLEARICDDPRLSLTTSTSAIA